MDCLRQPALGRTAAFGDLYDIEEATFLRTSEHWKFPPQAIYCFEHGQPYFQCLFMQTIPEKFNLFEVPPELQLHILGHVLEVKGSGRFLRAEKSSAKAVQVSLLCRMTTKKAILNMAHPECWKSINLEQLAERALPNKYLVTEITFGWMVVVSVQDRNEDDRETSIVVEELIRVLALLNDLLWSGTPLTERDFANTGHLSWTVYSDFVENSIPCPTFHDVVLQIENVIASSKYCNGGSGIPIFYTLCSLQRCLSVASPFRSPGCLGFPGIPRIDTDVTAFFVKVFDDISMKKQEVNDLHDAMKKYEICVTREDFELCNNLQKQFQTTYTEMWEVLANVLLDANCQFRLIDRITELKQEFEVKQYQPANFDLEMSNLHRVHAKIKLLDVLNKKGVTYCNSSDSYMSIITSHADVYILHHSTNARMTQFNWLDTWNAFMKMVNDPSIRAKDVLFVFADKDFATNTKTDITARICHVKNRKVISPDMLGDSMEKDKAVCRNADHCTTSCRKMKTSHCPSFTGSSTNLAQTFTCHAVGKNSNEGYPKPSPLKQDTDLRTPLVDNIPEKTEVHSNGVSSSSAQEADLQVPKPVKQVTGTSEGSNTGAVSKKPAKRHSQSASAQERVHEDKQERRQKRDQGRKDAKHDGAQKNDMQVYEAKQACINRRQQNKTEGKSAEPLSRDKPRQPIDQSTSKPMTDSPRHKHQGLSCSEGLLVSTDCAIPRIQTVSSSKIRKNVDDHPGSLHKTGNERDSKVVQGKTDKAAKGLTNELASSRISIKKKPLNEQDTNNTTADHQPEIHTKSAEPMHSQDQEPQGCSKLELMQGRRRAIVPIGRSQKPGLLQTGTGLPFHSDKRAQSHGHQSKEEGQCHAKDSARFKHAGHDRKTPAEVPPKNYSNTHSKALIGDSLEGPMTADHISGRCPPDEQFEDYEEEVGGSSGKAVNILLLGESGVGKSTWINGVANYLAYSTVQEAARSKPVHVIHSSFLLTDDDFNEVLVSMGPGGDGMAKLGASATQTTKSYRLPAGDRTVRLIDTPGIGDTRGMDKDQENFQSIFSHLSQLPQLHGICILLKPNSARMTASFQFCIRELLLHLHRDACKNVVFVFTSSRGTFYRPGDTFPTLSSLLRENKEVNIPLDSEHVYCMDNEPVRFLAATKQGVKFTESDKDNYSKSWEVSKAETDRLIAHVSGLEPHAVEKTLRLNDVMNASMAVAKPLVAFAKDLQVEILQAEMHVRAAQNTPKIPNVNHRDPNGRFAKMIVCCSTFCERARHPSSRSRTYSNICHRPCKHNIRLSDYFGNEDVKECEMMDMKSRICSSCGCDWWWHKCVRCELYVEHWKDSGYKNGYSENAGDQVSLEAEKAIAQMKLEQRSILHAGAKAGIFLKQNTIGACSDVVAEQLKRGIEKEREQVALCGSRQALDALTELLDTYKTEAGRLEDELKQKQTEIQFFEVPQSFDELRSLPIKGNVLRSRVVDVWNACCKTDDHHGNRTSSKEYRRN